MIQEITLPLKEFHAFGELLEMALTNDPDECSIAALIKQFGDLERTGKTGKLRDFPMTHYESDDPDTEPRVFSQGRGMERMIDVPVNDKKQRNEIK